VTRTFDKMGHTVYEYIWGPSEFTVTGSLKNYDRTARLQEIAIPTLFTCGRYDEAPLLQQPIARVDFPDQRSLFSRMLHVSVTLRDLNNMCR
jgi:proline iminopeptidase